MLKKNPLLIWTFIATGSSAVSTVLILFAASGKAWAPAVLQSYSVLAMTSGWANALIYFYVPKHRFLQRKTASALLLGAGTSLVLLGTWLLFGPIPKERVVFVIGAMTPLLYANGFGLEFTKGDPLRPYKIISVVNASFSLAALLCLTQPDPYLFLCYSFGAVGFFVAVFFSFYKWPHTSGFQRSGNPMRAWLNPSVPALERSVWDQQALQRLGATEMSLWIYLTGRSISFLGNVFYSYFLSKSLATERAENRHNSHYKIVIWGCVISIPLAMIFLSFTEGGLILGQILAWWISILLALSYTNGDGGYRSIAGFWLIDFVTRLITLLVSKNFSAYSNSTIGLTILIWLALLFVTWKKRRHLIAEIK